MIETEQLEQGVSSAAHALTLTWARKMEERAVWERDGAELLVGERWAEGHGGDEKAGRIEEEEEEEEVGEGEGRGEAQRENTHMGIRLKK